MHGVWSSILMAGALSLVTALLSEGGEVTAGTGDDIQCVPPPPPEPPPLALPSDAAQPLRDLELGTRLWRFLQQEAYRQRGEGFREEWAFHMLAASQGLGAPLAKSASTEQQVKQGSKAYGYQPFARDQLFNEIPRWSDVHSLNQTLNKALPASGLGRELLSAGYRVCGTSLKAEQAFAQRVVRDELGLGLSDGYAMNIVGTQYDIQAFAHDVLYSPTGQPADIHRLSETPAGALADSLWDQTYKRVAKASYDPNHDFHKRATAAGIGLPLTGVYRTNFEGHDLDIQVWTLDTVFAEPNGEPRLQSSLPKPSFSITKTVPPEIPEPSDALDDHTPTFGILPIAGQPQISQFYGYTRFSAGNGRVYYGSTQGRHSGVDFAVVVGTALLSIDYGLVVWAGPNVSGVSFGAGPESIIVRYGNLYALYGHTSQVAVQVGQFVEPGQVIGYSGFPSAPHLHFEFRPVPADTLGNRDPNQKPKNPGYAVNPIDYFSSSLSTYFQAQLSVLGGNRGHFCCGEINNQQQIIFGGAVDTRPCS